MWKIRAAEAVGDIGERQFRPVRVRPMVRMKSPKRFFWCARARSTAARIEDFIASARAAAFGIGLPAGWRRGIWLVSIRSASQLLFSCEQYAVGPDLRAGVLPAVEAPELPGAAAEVTAFHG